MHGRILSGALLLAVAGVAGGCQPKPKPRPAGATVEVGPPLKAERVEGGRDRRRRGPDRPARPRLAGALAEARKTNPNDVRREGELLMPRSALPRPTPTPGSYNCRLIKLGKAGAKGRTFESFKPFFCYVEVENDLLTIVKQTGSQRPAGRLWEDDDAKRMIFLGSLALGDEDTHRWPMATIPSATWPACSSGSRRSDGGWSSLAAGHLQARRVRTDPGRRPARMIPDEERAGLLADPAEVRAILVASAQAGRGDQLFRSARPARPPFQRPKMRALCKVLALCRR